MHNGYAKVNDCRMWRLIVGNYCKRDQYQEIYNWLQVFKNLEREEKLD